MRQHQIVLGWEVFVQTHFRDAAGFDNSVYAGGFYALAVEKLGCGLQNMLSEITCHKIKTKKSCDYTERYVLYQQTEQSVLHLLTLGDTHDYAVRFCH